MKDGVFKLLFENPENAAELYYALTGIKCDPDEIRIITITTAISGKLKNDLAFVARNRAMVLSEHQSTPNANMPVRFLMYTGQLYEKWFKLMGEEKLVYGSSLYKIPTPEFVVFYNGITERPEKEVLHLSTAYKEAPDCDLGFLELTVPVYNINKGRNLTLFEKSEKLKQYAEFVAKIREFQKLYNDFSQAVRKAVYYCIENGILVEFLKEHGGSIVSVLFAEYDIEIAKRVYAEEQVEEVMEKQAVKMLQDGIPLEQIIRYTSLPLDTIEQLRRQM